MGTGRAEQDLQPATTKAAKPHANEIQAPTIAHLGLSKPAGSELGRGSTDLTKSAPSGRQPPPRSACVTSPLSMPHIRLPKREKINYQSFMLGLLGPLQRARILAAL